MATGAQTVQETLAKLNERQREDWRKRAAWLEVLAEKAKDLHEAGLPEGVIVALMAQWVRIGPEGG